MVMGEKKAGIQQYSNCNPNRVIKSVIKDKEMYLQQHEIRPQLSLSAKNIDVRMSAVDLTQVLHNLIDNAIQAMLSGGVLTIKTSMAVRGGDLVVEVKDQGVGIPQDHLKHVFEPFFTTKVRGVRKNSGLGLPIAYSLVKDAHGDMQVNSSLRKGTVVKIDLPIYRFRRKSK